MQMPSMLQGEARKLVNGLLSVQMLITKSSPMQQIELRNRYSHLSLT
jgi:hypothetical protein